MTDSPRSAGDANPPAEADERGLYAVLGVRPSAADADIQVAYRRQAARISTAENGNPRRMRQLNTAYQVLGNPERRAEYDRERLAPRSVMSEQTRYMPQEVEPVLVNQRTRSRSRKGRVLGFGDGFSELVAVLLVVGLSAAAAVFVLRTLSFNFSGLTSLTGSSTTSPAASASAAPSASPAPAAATAEPAGLPIPSSLLGLVSRSSGGAGASPVPTASVADFAGTTATPQTANPALFGTESIVIKVRRNGQPAANAPVWLAVQYRTSQERWPTSGTVQTDATGTATITLSIGNATAGFQTTVQIYVVSDGNDLPVAQTAFTPQ